MKFSKLFQEVESFFENDQQNEDDLKKEELQKALEKKIESIRKEMKDKISDARHLKLKKRLEVLSEFKKKL